ncbi:hypothetical protein RYX36_002089, partial [Vicia faba]
GRTKTCARKNTTPYVQISYEEGSDCELKNTEDYYQEILEKADDVEFDVYMQSLCNQGTAWLESGGEKTVKGMYLRPESKAWY